MSSPISDYRKVNEKLDAKISLEGNTWINDIQLYIPPENIDVIKSANTDRIMTLRSNTSFKMQEGYSDVAITLSIPFPSGQGLSSEPFPLWNYKLKPLIAQIKKTPLIILQNEFVVSQFDRKYTNQYGTIPLTVENMSISTVENLPDTVSLIITCSYANLKPYMSDLLFRRVWKKDEDGSEAVNKTEYLSLIDGEYVSKLKSDITPYPINSKAFYDFFASDIAQLKVMESYGDKTEFTYKKYYVTNALTFNTAVLPAAFSYTTTEKEASFGANDLNMQITTGSSVSLNVDFKEKLAGITRAYVRNCLNEKGKLSGENLLNIFIKYGKITSNKAPRTYEDDIEALIDASNIVQINPNLKSDNVIVLSEAHLTGKALLIQIVDIKIIDIIQLFLKEGLGVIKITEQLYDVYDPSYESYDYSKEPSSNKAGHGKESSNPGLLPFRTPTNKLIQKSDGKIVANPEVINNLKKRIEKEVLPNGVSLDDLSFDNTLSYGTKVVFYQEFKIPLSLSYSIPTNITVTFVSNITKIKMNHYDYPTVQFMGGNDPIGSIVFMFLEQRGALELKYLQIMYDTVKENARLVKGKAKVTGVTINTPFLTDLIGMTNVLLENFQVSSVPQSPDARLAEITFTDTTSNANFRDTTLRSFNYAPTMAPKFYPRIIEGFFQEITDGGNNSLLNDIYRTSKIPHLYNYSFVQEPGLKVFWRPTWNPENQMATGSKGGAALDPKDPTYDPVDILVEMCRLLNQSTVNANQYVGSTYIKDRNGNLMNFDKLIKLLPFMYRIIYTMQEPDFGGNAKKLMTFEEKEMIKWATLAMCIIISKESGCQHFSSTGEVLKNFASYGDDIGIGQFHSSTFLNVEESHAKALKAYPTNLGLIEEQNNTGFYYSQAIISNKKTAGDFTGIDNVRVDTSPWGLLYYGLSESVLETGSDTRVPGKYRADMYKKENSTNGWDLTTTNSEFRENSFLFSSQALNDATAIVYAIRCRDLFLKRDVNQSYKRGMWVPYYPLKTRQLSGFDHPSIILDPLDPIQNLIASIFHFFYGRQRSKEITDSIFGEAGTTGDQFVIGFKSFGSDNTINIPISGKRVDIQKMKSGLGDLAFLYNQGTLDPRNKDGTPSKVRKEFGDKYRNDFLSLIEIAQLILGEDLKELDTIFSSVEVSKAALDANMIPNVNLNDNVSKITALSTFAANQGRLSSPGVAFTDPGTSKSNSNLEAIEQAKETDNSDFPVITDTYGFLDLISKYADPLCTDPKITPFIKERSDRARKKANEKVADKNTDAVVRTPTTFELNYDDAVAKIGEIILAYVIRNIINDSNYAKADATYLDTYTDALITGLSSRRLLGSAYPDLHLDTDNICLKNEFNINQPCDPDFYFANIDFRKSDTQAREDSLKTYTKQLYDSTFAGVNRNTKVDLIDDATRAISDAKFISFEFTASNLGQEDSDKPFDDPDYDTKLKKSSDDNKSGVEIDSQSEVDAKKHLFAGVETIGEQTVPVYAAKPGDAIIGNLEYKSSGKILSKGMKLNSMSFGAGKDSGLNKVNATTIGYEEAPFAGMNYSRASESQDKGGRYLTDYIKQMKRDYRVARRMYPTFKLYILEENTIESNWLAYDDFYSINTVQEIRIVRQKDNPADLCYIAIADLLGTFTSQKFSSETSRVLEATEFRRAEDLNTVFANPINNLLLKDGMCIQVRLGYSNDPNKLETVFNGKIVSVENESSIVNIICQSYGTELITTVKKNNDVGFIQKWANFDTDELLSMMITQPELKHFGRWKLSDPIGLPKNTLRADGKRRLSWTIFPKPNDVNICPPTQEDWGYIIRKINPVTLALRLFGFNYYYGFNMDGMTPWEVFRESMLRHPGYVTYPLPYETRMTMYFGHPNGMYIYREKTPVSFALGQDPDQIVNFVKNISDRLKRKGDPRVRNDQAGTDFVKNMLQNASCTKYFQNHWVAASHINLVHNGLKADSRDVYNKIIVRSTHGDNPGDTMNNGKKKVDPQEIELSPFLLDNEIRQTEFENRNIETTLHAIRYGTSILQQECQRLYKGDIALLGEPGIKPYDIVYIYDTTNQIFGFIEVDEVVHTLSRETGFITSIKPHMVTNTNENVNSPTNSAMMAFCFAWLTDSMKSDMIHDYRSATLLTEAVVAGATVAAALYAGPFMAFLSIVSGVAGVFGLDTKIMSWGIAKYPIILSPVMKNGVPYVFGLDSFNVDKTLTESLRFYWDKNVADFGLAIDTVQDNINALLNNKYTPPTGKK